MKRIPLIMIGLNSLVFTQDLTTPRFSKSGNSITDSKTGLVWEDKNEGQYNSWQEAVNYCDELVLDDHDDWRLPNINELKTIIDRNKVDPAIFEDFSIEHNDPHYWSSTTDDDALSDAWIVYFYTGSIYGFSKDESDYSVRCVRDE